MLHTLDDLREQLSRPSAGLVADLARLDGDLVVLGAAGKLGPSLVELACRGLAAAGRTATVHAVSRFSQPGSAEEMAATGARVVRADLSDPNVLDSLPDAPNVIFLIGSKFGTTGSEAQTWATNAYLPGRVAERYRGGRIVALSTGNVYPLSPVAGGGSREGDPVAPVGEYAMSCLGRERVLTHLCGDDTPLALIRLNYAVEMRYGVLVDVAARVVAGDPVDVTTGHANVVWQGYANEVVLRSLHHAATPPFVINLTGPETVSVRRVAHRMAEHLGREVTITGTEAATSLLSDASRCHGLFGYPALTLDQLATATADWVAAGRPLLGKPTKFQSRDGSF
jgi:uncharacterized protein YbjT (DUF2867 family)